MTRARLLAFGLVLLLPSFVFAGNALSVGGPNFGKDGEPFRWNPAAMPIHYTVDSGALSKIHDNSYGRQLVQSMFQVWQSVPTATISYSYSGPVFGGNGQPIADVSTIDQFNDVMGTCDQGKQSPVIFDADGSLTQDLGITDVIGFATPCLPTSTSDGYYSGAAVVMNGRYIDGDTSNGEIDSVVFNLAITHELGHFSGLGHSQANVSALNSYPCSDDLASGVPLMFPRLACAPITSSGLPVLAPDDLAELSRLYPNAQTPLTYGTLSGRVFFSDGVSQVQGANVVARRVDDPNTPEDESLRIVISAVSGNRFTGNPGQGITGDNTGGSPTRSRNTDYIGYFEMMVPAGSYTLEVESIDSSFVNGSSVGPLNPPVPLPGPAEYWNQNESAYDFPLQRDTITVHAGQTIDNLNIILNGTAPRLDDNELKGMLLHFPGARTFVRESNT